MSIVPSLSTLPLELKGRIAKLAHQQDARYKDLWSSGTRVGAELVGSVANDWHGRSLVALSRTSQQFYAVSAARLYRVSIQIVGEPHYLAHVRVVTASER